MILQQQMTSDKAGSGQVCNSIRLQITWLTVSANPPLWVKQISAMLFCFVNNIDENLAFEKLVKAESQSNSEGPDVVDEE